MAEGHKTTVVIEGDDSSLHRASSRSAQQMRTFESAVNKTGASAQKTSTAIATTSTQTNLLGGAANKAGPLLMKLNTAATAATGSSLGLGRSIANVASAFGPWGIAVSVAGNLLLDLVDHQDRAREATRKHTEEMRIQREEMRKISAEKAYTQLAEERRRSTEAATGLAGLRETEIFLEEEAARTRARGGTAHSEVVTAQAKARAAVLEAEAQAARAASDLETAHNLDVEAGNVLRHDRLRVIEEEQAAIVAIENAEKRVTKEKKEQFRWSAETINAIRMDRNLPRMGRGDSDTRDFESARLLAANAGTGGQIRRVGEPEVATSQAALEERLRAIELSRAAGGGDELERIETEKQARLEHLAVIEQAATSEEQILAAREQQRQVVHQAEMARIEAEKAARIQAQERIRNAIEATTSILGSGSRLAAMAAEATGASAKKQARVAQVGMGIQAMAIGALEVVKAAAAYASLNIPQGIAHTAAAAVAFTEGGLLLAGKIGGSGGGSSAGGGGSSSAGGGGAMGGSGAGSGGAAPGSDSPIPGSPGPQAPSAANGAGGGARNRSVVFNGPVHLYGTPHRDFIRTVDEGLEDLGHNRRRRSA